MNFLKIILLSSSVLTESLSYIQDISKTISEYKDLIPYMDIEYTKDFEKKTGRIRFQLFWDKTPKTSLNFAKLIEGKEKRGNLELKFEGSTFHRIIKGFMMQGGDFTNGNGTGGESIYGGSFKDENFDHEHDQGVLSMANRGPNTNTSQFFITFTSTPHLNNKHVVFGKLLDSKSMEVVKEIQNVKTVPYNDKPVYPVKIIKTGFESNNKEIF